MKKVIYSHDLHYLLNILKLKKVSFRVRNGKFVLDGLEHQLSKNDFGNDLRHHLHGGSKSYDRLLWNTHVLDTKDGVIFSVLDPHGSEVKAK